MAVLHDQRKGKCKAEGSAKNYKRESEVDGELGERITQRAHETWR